MSQKLDSDASPARADASIARALGASEERYRFLTENLPVQIWTSLPDGRLDYVGPQTAYNLGLTAERLLADGWQNVVHPDDLPRAVERWTHALATGTTYEVEFRLKTRTGDYAWHLARAIAERDPAGVIVRWFGTNTNIEEQREYRRQIETLLADSARLNEGLRQSEEMLRNLVDNLPELAWSALPDGYVDFYNRRWYEYTGATFEEMSGWGWERVQDPGFLPKVKAAWARCIETGEVFEMEFPLRRSDGAFRWFLTRVRPLRDGAGTIVRWFGTNTDIHAQREASRKAEEASSAKDIFLATASHELRTPLNAILGWARLLRSGQLDPSGYLRAVETIERNAKAQVQLIEDILDSSRIVTGNMHLEIRPLDLTTLVRAALDAVRPAADAKHIALATHLDADAARLTGDPDRLQQVVWNLANNAIKFTPKGGRVEVRLERAGTDVELSVRDSGQGIDADFLPHVFERFRQAEGSPTRRHGGLGLGLALARHLVEAHGGSVTATSEGEGRGATFTVRLPVRAAFSERAPLEPLGPIEGSLVPGPGLYGITVLVVDDEADARDLVATVLRTSGAAVTTAPNAGRALELLSLDPPMVLVSDVGMPGTDGYELIRSVRALADPRSAGVGAVALTAYAREEDRRLALEAGFHVHVAKPVDPTDLVRAVAALAPR